MKRISPGRRAALRARMFALSVLGVAGALALVACAEIQLGASGAKRLQRTSDARHGYKIGEPYQINGVWYYPREDYGYNETGIASFYGGERRGIDFHGRRTANGEIYDMTSLTAAHQTLPMPSLVRVTNLENGRQLVLRVNDRGPFAQNRILDVSRRGAQLLGFEQQGTARVRVEILEDESRQLKLALLNGSGGGGSPSVEQVAAAPRGSVSSDRLEPPAGARQSTGGGSALPPPSQTLPPDAASGARPPARSDVGLARPAPPVVAQPASPAAGGAQATVAASGFPRAVQTAALPPEAQSRVAPVLVQTSVQPTSLWVQVGAFSNYDNALRLSSRLRQFGATQIASVDAGAQRLYRVRIGPMQRVPDADQLLAQVANVAPEARIVVD